MSTVREHLGTLWLVRHKFGKTRDWEALAVLLVSAHLDELIQMAGGADIEECWRQHFPEIPADFPSATALQSPSQEADDSQKGGA